MKTLDGNEAAAHVAYRINEVCAIYPITPSSPMAELADQWATQGHSNIWGSVPEVIEMQSEGGAAGAMHGALQTGALTTTFTASQGLLLMIPNMYKIAGELTPAVIHVAARSVAAQALSIFGDHSDVAAVRETGFAQLASASVQEAHDMALLAQAASLGSRIPFVHFFDGFRTSHELNQIEVLGDDVLRALITPELVRAHRARALSPDDPVIRGTAQNPDVFFQARETINPFYDKLPAIVAERFEGFAALTGRRYQLFDYAGHPEPDRVAVIAGSGGETLRETAAFLQRRGERVGVIQARLCLPFSAEHFFRALPPSTRAIAVLDRCKSPGAAGEPLYRDVVTSLAEREEEGAARPRVVGGRYGLSSKEFTPAMAAGVFDALVAERPQNHFTIGIRDDVAGTSLSYDASFELEPAGTVRALFYGLGADGTVSANKNSIKIIAEGSGHYAQGYFVYDSKKAGARTVSHLRFGPSPIRAPYLLQSATFVACHNFAFVYDIDILERACHGATLVLNSPYGPGEVWAMLPRRLQDKIVDKDISLHVIDASRVARESGLGTRINTVMQTAFFALAGVLPADDAIARIKASIRDTYGRKSERLARRNFAAVDRSLDALAEVSPPPRAEGAIAMREPVPPRAPAFEREVTAPIMAGKGDALPVSALPADGTYPLGTAKWEKRNISDLVPVWEPDLCIQCGNCSFVCPHSVIRAKFYPASQLEGAPEGFQAAPLNARGYPDTRYTLQIYSEDCTGCGLCVEACPVRSPTESGVRAINMREISLSSRERERERIAFFEDIPQNDRERVDFSSVRGTQFLEPLFEFSGACAGCGETPYIRLLSQLFGDRLLVANATGCSSIYGGNLPTTPWTQNAEGRGPAWSNSLFEDNAEFGLGFRLTADQHAAHARSLAEALKAELGPALVDEILCAPQQSESEIRAQRERVARLKTALVSMEGDKVRDLASVADQLVRRSVWLVGGDGWAYDIGSAGLDHVLASGRDVNVLVLDTEVYSNTGGQASKATPLGAVAKFAAAGKPLAKKDAALQAIAYGNVYVARVAMGANPQQTLLAMREAEAYPGPSIILAYSQCIAHGIDMSRGMDQQDLAVASGYWPLMRYNPALRKAQESPMVLDSPRPRIRLKDYRQNELRFSMLERLDPGESERLSEMAQRVVDQTFATYEDMARRKGSEFSPDASMESAAQRARAEGREQD